MKIRIAILAALASTLALADVARAEKGFEIGGILGGVGKANEKPGGAGDGSIGNAGTGAINVRVKSKQGSALPKTQKQNAAPGVSRDPGATGSAKR